jgi:inner membrane protein
VIWAGGVIATRYIERMPNVALGYLAFVLLAVLLSLLRAFLFQQSRGGEEPRQRLSKQELLDIGVHNLTYLLFAIVVYLILSFLLRRPADPFLLIPVCIGALLPDLDSQTSLPGRLLPFISQPLETRFGHLGIWHTVPAAALVALTFAPLIPLLGLEAWYLLPLGFLAHLLVDLFRPEGIMVFWPASHNRHCFVGGPIKAQGGSAERWLAGALAITTLALLFAVDARRPLPAPSPSYEQTVARYYGLRGRNLVFAGVQGTWQATGRRIGARFEILNAVGESFIMLDRFTGTVFTAGRDAFDNLYINHISLQPGAEAQTKAVEVHLQDDSLLEALPTLYQMQREPGLQHIFVSGDLIMPALQDTVSPSLPVDYAQTSLRKIQSPGPGHYTLHYLTAAELIGLADLQVDTADLVIVATYASLEAKATPTPLPSPPPSTGSTP